MSSPERSTGRRAATDQAVWLALEPHPVLAFLYLPPHSDRARVPDAGATAVLLCPPFGWEETCSYRGRRVWLQTLARAGYPAATLALPGSGDSGGSPRDPDQLDAWTDAVGETARWLRATTGADRVTAIGIGLGGLLACRALAAGAPLDDLILWGVPVRGRSWLRELRAYAQIVAARYPEDHRPEIDPEGEHEYIGFLLNAETRTALERLRLTELDVAGAGRRVLLLGRDGIAPDSALREHFERSGAAVSADDGEGYGALMLDPQEAQPPQATIAKTVSWLAEVVPARPRGRAPTAHAVERGSIVMAGSGGAIREMLLSFEGPGGRLFGILSESVERDRAPICAVWLNGGALRHTGPNRAWVEAARRSAARGVATVRVDLAGLGDSDGAENRVSNPHLYAPGRTEETLAILDQLAARGLPSRFVLGGLCSGAYWSLHAALADDRVAGALLINLYAFFWSEALVAERQTQDSLSALRGSGWRRLARRDVTLADVRAAAASLRPTRLRAGAGHPVERAQSAEIEAALDKLRDQRTAALLLFSGGEGLHVQLERQGVLDRLHRWPNLTVHEIPSNDHMFRALWLQRHVHELLDRALDRVLADARHFAGR